jgi:flagellar M-ring protein FliF
VTVVDQDGNLLTQSSSGAGLDASQLKYVRQIEHDTQARIDAILAPLFGAGNARSQVSADVDFSKLEQTSENYGPNGSPQQSSIRSQQQSIDTETQQGGASGVPGALSNQPPQPASAPVSAPPAGANGAPATTPISDHRDTTTNYELDKTVRDFQQAPGDIKRLSVAVIVNYQPKVDAKGHTTMQPLDDKTKAQVEQLVRDAMGYDEKRGDSVNVVNAAFQQAVDPDANLPWWRQPDIIALAKQIATWLGIGAVALFLYFAMVKPALRRAFPPPAPPAPALAGADDHEPLLLDGLPMAEKKAEDHDGEAALLSFENEKNKFERNLEYARTIARQDPKIVATVVKAWVNDER